jgi:hypothetical protein
VARGEGRKDVIDSGTTQRASQSDSKTPSRRRHHHHHHHHHHKYYSRIPSVVLEPKPEVLRNSVGKPARKHSSRRPRRKWKRNTQLNLEETGKDCVKTDFKWLRTGSIRIMFAFFMSAFFVGSPVMGRSPVRGLLQTSYNTQQFEKSVLKWNEPQGLMLKKRRTQRTARSFCVENEFV